MILIFKDGTTTKRDDIPQGVQSLIAIHPRDLVAPPPGMSMPLARSLPTVAMKVCELVHDRACPRAAGHFGRIAVEVGTPDGVRDTALAAQGLCNCVGPMVGTDQVQVAVKVQHPSAPELVASRVDMDETSHRMVIMTSIDYQGRDFLAWWLRAAEYMTVTVEATAGVQVKCEDVLLVSWETERLNNGLLPARVSATIRLNVRRFVWPRP